AQRKRHRQNRSVVNNVGEMGAGIDGFNAHIRDLGNGAAQYRTAASCVLARRPREHALKGFQPFSAQAVAAGEMKEVAVKAHYKGELAAAQPHRALGNHVDHRLDISWSATDTFEHLAGRGPVFKSLRQLLRPSLHLVEQPRVLDRDHRLVGEGCSELDLFLGECPYLGATDTE